MFTSRKSTADKRERNGLVSHFLLGKGDVDGDAMAITWVDVNPGSRQELHHHPQVQVYVIVRGQGRMHVGGETQDVQVGDMAYIPSNAMHGIENTGSELLSYVSAASPAIDLVAAYDRS
jgi:methionyl-tRNA synthetase